MLHELVLTYPSSARVMISWLEQWELDFHRRYDKTERHTLIDVRSLLAELEERLRAIERPEADADRLVVHGPERREVAERVQKLMDRALGDVESIHGTLRASLDLLGVHATAQQLRLAQDQAQSAERLQTRARDRHVACCSCRRSSPASSARTPRCRARASGGASC